MTSDDWKKLMARRGENVLRTKNFSLVTWIKYEPRNPDWTLDDEIEKRRRGNEQQGKADGGFLRI